MTRNQPGSLVLATLVVALAACGPRPEAGSATREEPAPAPTRAPAPAEGLVLNAELENRLAAADLVDGTADRTVERCPGCGLAMPGTSEHALAVGDYSLHFCSEGCKERFSQDLEGSLMALAVPSEDANSADADAEETR